MCAAKVRRIGGLTTSIGVSSQMSKPRSVCLGLYEKPVHCKRFDINHGHRASTGITMSRLRILPVGPLRQIVEGYRPRRKGSLGLSNDVEAASVWIRDPEMHAVSPAAVRDCSS